MCEKRIYRLDDDISFRKCTLSEGAKLDYGDCTNFTETEQNWKTYYVCQSNGIHFHCTKHPEIELNSIRDYSKIILMCPKCNNEIEVDNFHDLISRCLKLLNIELFKDVSLIRLDDWYVPEVKQKEKHETGYWINTNVKTDKDGDTVIVVYVGHKDSKKKAQFFVKPEKLQLSSDHKDMDSAKVLSKIEVTFKDRRLSQVYDK